MLFSLRNVWRSILFQIMASTFIFALVLFWFFLIDPLMTSLSYLTKDKDIEKYNLRHLAIFFEEKYLNNSEDYHDLDDPISERILKANPSLSYTVYNEKGKVASNEISDAHQRDRFYDRLPIDKLKIISQFLSESENNCLSLTKRKFFSTIEGQGFYNLELCGDKFSFIEINGLTKPIEENFLQRLVLQFTHGTITPRYIYIGGGVLILVCLVIFNSMRSLRKIVAIMDKFSPDKRGMILPTNSVPLEVVPLIEALNTMIQRMDQYQRKHEFFLATSAHEIKTPLTVLRLQVDQLPESVVKGELVESVLELSMLNEQLLKLMELSSWEIGDSAADLVGACQNSIHQLEKKAYVASVNLVFETKCEDWYIRGSQSLVELAIKNIINNAISFSKAGDTVTIKLDDKGVVHVLDEGCGFNLNKVDELFEPFSKFPPNRVGHGLGLAIVKAVITLHSGKVFLNNQAVGGAHVSLRFLPD